MYALTMTTSASFGSRDARVVECFVETMAAERAGPCQTFQVADRRLRVDHRGKRCRIRRDDEVFAQTAFETEARHAEVRVLISQLEIAGAIRRFGDAPRYMARNAIVDLPAHDQSIGLFEQTAGRCTHDERGHQVFEHRTRP